MLPRKKLISTPSTTHSSLSFFRQDLALYLEAHHLIFFLLSALIITTPIQVTIKKQSNQSHQLLHLSLLLQLTLTTSYLLVERGWSGSVAGPLEFNDYKLMRPK